MTFVFSVIIVAIKKLKRVLNLLVLVMINVKYIKIQNFLLNISMKMIYFIEKKLSKYLL